MGRWDHYGGKNISSLLPCSNLCCVFSIARFSSIPFVVLHTVSTGQHPTEISNSIVWVKKSQMSNINSNGTNAQELQELVIRPIARKVMDLTLGRYQVLEQDRHRIPEFLTMCASDVENVLVAFSKIDMDRASADARAAQKQQHTGQRDVIQKKDVEGLEDGDESALEARARHLDEEDEEARVAALTPHQYITELKLQLLRSKATENFLRSTVSDVLRELDHRSTALEIKSGQIVQRDRRLAKLRDAFLRENRQLRDMVAQFREKGKCDLPEPILYEWDADETGGSGSATDRGRGSSNAQDPFQQLRAELREEKDVMEKAFVKQLEEANFKVRSLQAQVTSAARSKLELQQVVTQLESQLSSLEAARVEVACVAARANPGTETPLVVEPEGSLPVPLQPSLVNDEEPPSIAPRRLPSVDAGVQTTIETPRPAATPTPPPAFTVDVDPALQDALFARQLTPDGLGSNIVRSVSTTALASNPASDISPQPSPAVHKQTNANVHKQPARPLSKGGASKGTPVTGKKHNQQAGDLKKRPQSHVQPPPVEVAPTLHDEVDRPVDVLMLDALEQQASSQCASSAVDSMRMNPDGSGASPWSDALPCSNADGGNAHLLSSALESTARTPSQLETLKHLEEQQGAEDGSTAACGHPPKAASHISPSAQRDRKLLSELQRLRVENEQLRISMSSTRVSGASAPQNNTLLLARLKCDLREKSILLEERTEELEQLRSEAQRWFHVYKQYVPPEDVDIRGDGQQQLPVPRTSSNGTGGHAPLVVNYTIVARLKATVSAAEAAEERYRLLSWKVMGYHVRSALTREAHIHELRAAQKQGDSVTIVHTLQRQLEMLSYHQQQSYIRLRTKRAAARVESNILWDKVLAMARNVSRLQSVEENPDTPRYYLRSPRTLETRGAVEDVVHARPTTAPGGNIHEAGGGEPTSVYFRVVSNAAAAFSLHNVSPHRVDASVREGNGVHLSLGRIPVRGVSAASPQTLLPQRPHSASSALDDHAPSLPQKLRSAVSRPMSAAMARHGGHMPAAPPEDKVPSTAPPAGHFQPSALRNLSGDHRREKILSAMRRDKVHDAHAKLQLVEERRMLRASSGAARVPDMSRVEQPVFHMAKLVGRNEPAV